MKNTIYLFLFSTLLFSIGCKTKCPTPFNSGNKWYALYGNKKLPIILGDTLFIYELDTTVMKEMKNMDDYMDKIHEAMKLSRKVKFTYTDSAIMYVKYQEDSMAKNDTTIMEYELLTVDSIPLLKFDNKYLVPWDKRKNYGVAKTTKLKDHVSEMEVGGFKLGQKIDEERWIKTGEKISFQNGCPVGQYKNLHNDELDAETYDGYIYDLSYDDFSGSEEEELIRLYKYHEQDTLEFDNKTEYWEHTYKGNSKKGTYFGIYKTKEIKVYGYVISRERYYSTLNNSTFLDLLTVLKHVREQK